MIFSGALHLNESDWAKGADLIDSTSNDNLAFARIDSSTWAEPRMQYPLIGMDHAEFGCYLRATVADMLRRAAAALPNGMRFAIWDAWRPLALQEELYYTYRDQIIREFSLEALSDDAREKFIANYVALPIADRAHPPAHTTGGAVDLTIIDADGLYLQMGTEFDSFSNQTAALWYEDCTHRTNDDTNWELIRDNRRMLRSAMEQAGFTILPSEWWHFDFGDSNWAGTTGREQIYPGCFERTELSFAR